MATVTSLTAQRILELAAGWQEIAADHEDTKVVVSELNGRLEQNEATLTEFRETTLPTLAETLTQNAIQVSTLSDNTIPALDERLSDSQLDITNLNTVSVPALQTQIDSNFGWITELNEETLPALQVQLDENAASIATLNDTTLPALDIRLSEAEAAVGAGGDTTQLQADLDAAEANIFLLASKFPIEAEDIAANAVTANAIAANAITATQISTGAVTASAILANTITANEIAAGAITADEIAAGAVTAAEILSNTITANEIASGAITADEIAVGAVTTNKIFAGAVTANEIAAGAITADEIAADAVTTSKIFAGAVTAEEIASNAIIADKIDTDAVTAGKIDADAVTAREILAGTITASEIAAGTITAAQIESGTITSNEIHSGTIVAANIKAGEITGDLLSGNVILASTRIAAEGSLGQSVELNPDGFFVYGPTDVSGVNPTLISFPTKGGVVDRPNIISGTLQATTLSVDGDPVTGQATTFRANNQMEQGATFTLNNAIIAPIGKPSVEAVSEMIKTTTTGNRNDGAGCWYNGEYYFVSYVATGGGSYSNTVKKWNQVTNVTTTVAVIKYGTNVNLRAEGIQRVGTSFVVLFASSELSPTLYLARYDDSTGWAANAAGIQVATIPVVAGATTRTRMRCIGTDGTYIWLATATAPDGVANQAIQFRKFLANLSSAAVQETVNTTVTPTSYAAGTNHYMTSLLVGNFDLGARKFMVTYTETYNDLWFEAWRFAVFGTTGVREPANEWELMGLDATWLSHDGTNFRDFHIPYGQSYYEVHKYSNIQLTGKTQPWYVGTTSYRSSDGAETTLSPQSTLTMKQRWMWKATVTTPPSGLDTRIYIGTATGSVNAKRQVATPGVGKIGVVSAVYSPAGVVPPTSSSFGAGFPSLIQSQQTISQAVAVGITSGSTTITGTGLQAYMVGRVIAGTGIPAGATIVSVTPGVNAVISAAATATNAALTATLTLPRLEIRGDGYARIAELERVIISSTTDASISAGNQPALRVGDVAGLHLRVDGNEIQCMGSDAAAGALGINLGGGNVTVGSPSAGTVSLQGATTTMQGKGFSGWNYAITSGTTDVNGDLLVTHGAGVVPVGIVVVGLGQESLSNFYHVWDRTSTTFRVRVRSNTGVVQASVVRQISWIAFG